MERIYSIPLRKEARKGPKYMQANKAVRAIREFLQKHMKCKNVKLGRYLNMKVLEHGRKNIPHHVEVKAVKELEKDIEVVRAELVGAPVEEVKEEEGKKEKKKKVKEKEISKVIKEKEKEREKLEKTPKPKRGELADEASKDVASGVMKTRVTKPETQKHMKPKEKK